MPWAGEGYRRSDTPQTPRAICLVVLPWCASIVRVFRRCQPQISVGMGVLWQGVTASEVRAACIMLDVPRRDWARHVDGVQLMARVVADLRNADKPHK